MDMNSGRVGFIPDEELKTLRLPHTKELSVTHSKELSVTAEEFIPKNLSKVGRITTATQSEDVVVVVPDVSVTPAATTSINSSSALQKRLQAIQHSSHFSPNARIAMPPTTMHAETATEIVPTTNTITVSAAAAAEATATVPPPPSHNGHHTIPQAFCSSAVQNRLKIYNNGIGSSGGGGGGGGGDGSGDNSTYNYAQQQHQHPNDEQFYSSNTNSTNSSSIEVETIALDYLSTVIKCLNENPGSFDNVATRFLNIFDGMENNNYVLSNAMEDIFNHSINNPNFRYMGAKLYNLLHMLNLRPDSLFHTLLKCKLNYHQTEVMDFMKTSPRKVHETALFLAELYMQLRGDDSRIHLIAENIVYSLKQLLTKITSDNIRCICLTLKLAGYDLDKDCPNDIQYIIEQLDSINIDNPGKYPLITNIISLQRKNWGRKMQSQSQSESSRQSVMTATTTIGTAASEAATTTNNDILPTLYGPDGKILTEEENYFLTENAQSPKNNGQNGYNIMNGYPSDGGGNSNLSHGIGGNSGGGGDDDDIIDSDIEFDPEMDEETEKAYRRFCKLTMMASAATAAANNNNT